MDKAASEELKSEFDSIYKEYRKQAKRYNDELIAMARKDPNKLDQSGHSPLYYAIQYADLGTVNQILKLGANPNKASKYDSIFSNHVRKNENLVHALFNAGANPFAPFRNDPNYSIFSLAIFGNAQFCDPIFAFECLIAAKNSFHPLFHAARDGLSSAMIDDLIINILVFRDNKNSIYMNRLEEFYYMDPKRFISMLEKMNSNDPQLWKWKRNPPHKSDVKAVIEKFNEMTKEMLKNIKDEKSSKLKLSPAKTSFFKRNQAVKNEPKITESKKLK
jgi:ankyrin repeat protein